MDSIFGKVLGFACGRRTIKTGKVLWQQIKHLPTMGYGTDMLKSYENFIPHAKHYAGKTFTTQIESLNCRLRHYLARLHRKTLCYSKSKTMLEVSLKLLIHQLNKESNLELQRQFVLLVFIRIHKMWLSAVK